MISPEEVRNGGKVKTLNCELNVPLCGPALGVVELIGQARGFLDTIVTPN
jgi:hypothetical protein